MFKPRSAVEECYQNVERREKIEIYRKDLEFLFNLAKDPYFTNLPQTVTVLDTAALGTHLYTVSYTDNNAGDLPYLTIQKTGSSDFLLDTATGEINF